MNRKKRRRKNHNNSIKGQNSIQSFTPDSKLKCRCQAKVNDVFFLSFSSDIDSSLLIYFSMSYCMRVYIRIFFSLSINNKPILLVVVVVVVIFFPNSEKNIENQSEIRITIFLCFFFSFHFILF